MIVLRSRGASGAIVAVLAAVFAWEAIAEDAEAIIKHGIELRKKGQDQAALAEFRRALAIKETPRVFAQLGLAEQALGLWIAAEEHLGRAVKQERDPWVARNRNVLDAALATISGHLGTVEVWGEPTGAEVIVNGQVAGTFPAAHSVRVVAGECSLVVRAEGYRQTERTLQVGAGDFVRENVQLVRSVIPQPRVASREAAPVVVASGTTAAPTSEPPAVPTSEHSSVTGKWWFWTVIGVAVVGGAAGAFLLSRPRGVNCPDGVVCPP